MVVAQNVREAEVTEQDSLLLMQNLRHNRRMSNGGNTDVVPMMDESFSESEMRCYASNLQPGQLVSAEAGDTVKEHSGTSSAFVQASYANTSIHGNHSPLRLRSKLIIDHIKVLLTVQKIVPDGYELVSNIPADSASQISSEAGGVKKNGTQVLSIKSGANKVVLTMIWAISLILAAIIFSVMRNTSHDQNFEVPT